MLVPAQPANESRRIATLRSLSILDTSPEERFDRLTRLAKRLFDVPIALVSLVDEDRQWFKSKVGIDVCETPRDISFCGHAILEDNVLLIPDVQQDPRFHDNPLVTGEPRIRFYAGCPLRVSNGSKLGTFCLLDTKPRQLDEGELAMLWDLAHIAEREIAAVQLANMDELTLLANRRGFEGLASHTLTVCKRLGRPASLLYFDLNDFKNINDTYGHAEGDFALTTFADIVRSVVRESDVVGRLSGDEFVVLLIDTDIPRVYEVVARLRYALAARNRDARRGYDIRFSVGQVVYDPERHPSIGRLLADADAAMYVDKHTLKASGEIGQRGMRR